jgi:protein arginine N-methyltransferase 3
LKNKQRFILNRENGYFHKIVFLKGKVEEVKLPVEKVDIIISEWMGYFLVFESMLDSVLYARDKYLNKETGIVLPNFFEMHLFAVHDPETHQKTVQFWSDVYGFKMSCMKRIVVNDTQVLTLNKEHVVSDMFKFKEIDCMNCTVEDVATFESEFELKIDQDTQLTGIGSSFETYFNHEMLENKVIFLNT